MRTRLTGVDPQLCTGYACLLYFAEKVCYTLQKRFGHSNFISAYKSGVNTKAWGSVEWEKGTDKVIQTLEA